MGEKRYPPGYGPVAPVADYRPWDVDTAFSAVFEQVSEYTKLDLFRAYALWRYAEQSAKLPGDILEVGVWRGGSAALMAAALREFGISDKRVVLADTFRGVVKAGPRDDYYKGGEHADTSETIVRELFTRLDLDGYDLLVGVFPDETAGLLSADRRFAICHVDVDVYQSARDVADWVWPRLPVGGLLVYDDYGFYGCEGVTALGNEEFRAADRIVTHNLNGQLVAVKLPSG
ncbi:MAG: methyltransferase [Spirochaetaceae bacterium]|nr:MAG: methyltransferase [Spirochaetaceae bacterium]